MSQFALPMTLPPAYGAEQFICTPANQQTYDWLVRWPDWPSHALYLYAEHGSGKTHLAHLWQQKNAAVFLPYDSEILPTSACIIDGLQQWRNAERLFHLLNHVLLQKIPTLITSTQAPDDLSITLPDVVSRLKALPLVTIAPPDDLLLQAILCKQLADRQLKISEEVLQYLLPRLPRSYASVAELVEKIDQASLAAGRTLTLPFIRQTLAW